MPDQGLKTQNLLFIISDMYTRGLVGCYGNNIVQTPNLDRLAARGTRFAQAYCNSPLCVPSRASLATGRPAHEVSSWGNGHPYNGDTPGWAHRLVDAGHKVTSIGKLHYRDSRDSNGFDEEILPMHVPDGVGDLLGLIRENPPTYMSSRSLAEDAGPGESSYTEYDRKITAASCDWLENKAQDHGDTPWVLFVSLVSPHFPLTAPEEFYNLYAQTDMPHPRLYREEERPSHPCIDVLRRSFNYDDYFNEEKILKAVRAYYGLCSYLDDNVGKILNSLGASGFEDETRVIFTADHGDSLGNHGLWGTSTMYEESVGIPLIMAGADVPQGKAVNTNVSLLDLYPTIVESVGEKLTEAEIALPGESLFDIAKADEKPRVILSEYHGGGSNTGTFMLRTGRWKYIHYVGYRPQLFDLEADPIEAHDLGDDPDYEVVRAQCEAELRTLVHPEAINSKAFAEQAALIEKHGGTDAILERGDFGFSPAPDT